MKVLRIELDAPICSFRYPHFLVGQQLTFDLPPPSTIYGHVASAMGEFPDPASFQFAYWFSSRAKGNDLEKQHIETLSTSKFTVAGEKYQAAVAVSIQPVHREFLFDTKLVLYIDKPEWKEYFQSPRFTVVLGRSQDLACYVRIDEVELKKSDRGYFENTLLPFEFRRRTACGISVLMPRYLGLPPYREPIFEKYIVLRERIFFGSNEEDDDLGSRNMMEIDGEEREFWIDPDSSEWKKGQRALTFHSFV